ncbi:unnamed protein product [Bemisia tabaci]|uniref:EGF-like domain-containing protein n=1 Tax=Bemisia tabaci TaxID=7038 RepID=A0A9P0A852_BEMTA|nr:PREDICTED: uncharacterized protein LOC109030191 isoform X2 [Bemisia tabaci]CAH0385369.1 unnamed protein product [Bemisia tabaci]
MSVFWVVLVSVLFLDVFHASVVEAPEGSPELKRSKRLTTFGGGGSQNQQNQNQNQNAQNKKPLHQPCRSDYDCGTSNSECKANASSYNPTMMCYCKENYEEIDNECSGAAAATSTILTLSLAILVAKLYKFYDF